MKEEEFKIDLGQGEIDETKNVALLTENKAKLADVE
jgi:hypothetical protein